MTQSQLEQQLLSLTPVEKAQAIQILTQTLQNETSGITKTPGVCGGAACIANTRIPVWVLVGYRRLKISDAELLKCYPTLTAIDLVNAWAYAAAYGEEIEQAIRDNEQG
ncbi:protein of unknown function DUF433 [Gloeothece citriformis PCC 7424]|uniref:DUF433 domain-containing protein n=1 Tax=Gloeothece citriformis (strain PCC 7424) TaxID=65393 RepID=B7KJH9_GLOC7|nr:DUF433 domain-containing protein [Gloeothece citriformis]ACK73656.1 protein of unknown function DUF433 [Gloeothece citriformis PCC 7424]